ncbi:hypothetical protein JCM10207_003437 [Rhodosporidiobolus poonsookiae]
MSRQPFAMGKGTDKSDPAFYLPSKPARPDLGTRQRSESPGGLLGRIGLAQPSLSISLPQDVFFLHPSPEGVPTDDELVSGTVTLWLPKPRTIRHLTVRLIARYDIGWNDSSPYESGVCLERTVSLLGEGEEVHLEKGEHVFEFMIIVPANSACYERCQYGRVRHSITAKAKHLGPMGGDLYSQERAVFCVINPGLEEVSKPPPPLHLKFEGSLDEVGPYSMSMQSQHIMVGGLLLFRLSLLFPPVNLIVYSVKVKIMQQFTLRSPVDRKHTSSPPPSPVTVFILDSAHPPNDAKVQDDGRGARSGSQTPRIGPLKTLHKDEMWNIVHLARLPNDNYIRPSTPEGTDSPITVHHTIQMEMTYRPMTEEESNPELREGKGKGKDKDKQPEPERRKVVMSKPLDIFSCCCFLDSLTLPVYSLLDPNPMPLEAELQLPCVCGMTLKALIDKHANALLIEGSDTTIEYVAPPKTDSHATSPISERPSTLWEEEEDAEGMLSIRGRDRSRRPRPDRLLSLATLSLNNHHHASSGSSSQPRTPDALSPTSALTSSPLSRSASREPPSRTSSGVHLPSMLGPAGEPLDPPPSFAASEEADTSRGRSTSRRASPANSRPASREPSQTRSGGGGGFFRVGSSSERLFAMAGWGRPSSSNRRDRSERDREAEDRGRSSTSRSGSRAPSRAASLQRG